MDKLYEAAKFYQENLEKRKFHLVAGKNKTTIEFNIVFGVENFKHLLGLNKLIDLEISKLSSATSYLQILKKEVTFEDIRKSEYFYLMEPRLNNFQATKATLNSKELMIKSLHGEFNTIRADFMLTNRDKKYGFAHLFLKGDNVTFPVTFIIHSNNSYLRNNPNKWVVLSIEEIPRAGKI